MTSTDFETLSQEIGELRASRDRLAAALAESIARLRSAGTCPPGEVLDHAGRYRRQYLDTRQRLSRERCAELADPRASLEDWELALQRLQRQQQVTRLLDDAESWHVRGMEGPGPLAIIRDDVQQLRQRLGHDPDHVLDGLLEGRHPLAAVRTLIHLDDELSDGEWEELLDRVAEGYGRELATAVSRGKILVRVGNPVSEAASAVTIDRKIEVLP